MYRVGLDIGGTFSDVITIDDKGKIFLDKVASRPAEPEKALREGFELAASNFSLSLADFAMQCALLVHGTTIATNALIQHKGAKTGLISTKGLTDQLELRLGTKDGSPYDYMWDPAEVLVPRPLRIGVEERILTSGEVLTPLDVEDVWAAIRKFEKEGVEAVAVGFMSSYVNPIHERRVQEILLSSGSFSEDNISLSVDVIPRMGFYSRLSTVVIDAYLKPSVIAYVDRVTRIVRSFGYQGNVLYMQGNGGVSSGELVKKRPVMFLNSGPSAGPVAGTYWARLYRKEDVINLDMGGTSADASLVKQGQPDVVRDVDVCRYRVGTPLVNVYTIGAGGGSIAWINPAGLLEVGPQSAEAVPGPACYGLGGTEATVTDADVVAGYFNPNYMLGGRFKVDSEASRKVIEERIAKPLNIDLKHAALAIYKVVNTNMIGAIKTISVERGHDPRDFVFIAAGGCTPAHAARLMAELEMPVTIMPRITSGFCAFGETVADICNDHGRSFPCRLNEADANNLDKCFKELEVEGYNDLKTTLPIRNEDVRVRRSLEGRYVDQVHELSFDVPSYVTIDELIPKIAEQFHQRHEALYTYCEKDNIIEIINMTVGVSGKLPPPAISRQPRQSPDPSKAKFTERPVLFEENTDYVMTPIFRGENLRAGNVIKGPGIVEEVTTTIVVPPGFNLELDPHDFYILTQCSG